MAFICGSHANQEEDDFEVFFSVPSTPQRKPTRRHSFCSRSNKENNKNPYSNRGLDKFEALLADLDGKRQKIYTQKGSEDISLVRFVYSSSSDVKPIIVKVKNQKKQDKDQKKQDKDHNIKLENTKLSILPPKHHGEARNTSRDMVIMQQGKSWYSVDQLSKKFGEWWKPWYSLPLFVILVLVFLIFFGRSVAILCTSLGWYLVPMINERSDNMKKPKKNMKKEYSRKASEKIVTSPRSVLNNNGLIS
uniref:uncharacterized protein LOC122580124 n=1 Tax=Erigeron canadensis TaxID=72917 RepID=UPI001CB9CFFF|nr:uncharacterized protein LOC122580124 [Erigeron canadensis]